MRPSSSLDITGISLAAGLLAAAVGASYAYVDLMLNRMGASGAAIGLNAAMPALGWLLATPLMPWVLRRFNPGLVMAGLLMTAAVAFPGFELLHDERAWMVFRFLFGGSVGMLFRLIEYWINAASPSHRRGRNQGVYASLFCAGAVVGTGVVPFTGTEGWPTILLILGLLCVGAAALSAAASGLPGIAAPSRRRWTGGVTAVALAAVLAYGLFEAVPLTLMPVYALRAGMPESWAAWTASAYLAGALLFPVPMGYLADRGSKPALLALCAVVSLAMPAVLPELLDRPEAVLAGMMVWGGVAGSLYTVSLAMLADGAPAAADLAAANAVFGTLYAAGALVGPVLHGSAMDWHDPQGLMASACLPFAAFLGFLLWRTRPGRSGP